MHINDFFVDGFGIFANQQVTHMPSGLNIFLGNNEAGKSTCLEFFRTMLFGFPPNKGAGRAKQYPPLRGGNEGGILSLETALSGPLRLERRRGTKGGLLTLTTPDGSPLDAILLDKLLGGVTRDVYEAVYAFSLTELQTDTLSADNVRHALYGAAFGSGTRPVGEVLKELDNKMSTLFKPRGQSQPVIKKLKELETIRIALRDHSDALPRYDELVNSNQQAQEALKSLRNQIRKLKNEKEQTQRHLGLWEQWVARQSLIEQRNQLQPIVVDFPQNGIDRLETLNARLQELELSKQETSSFLQQIQADIESSAPDTKILDAAPAIVAQQEGKERFRIAQKELANQQNQNATLREQLTTEQAKLGPDWDDALVMQFDLSPVSRERINHFATQFEQASSEIQTAQETLADREKEHGDAIHQRELAQKEQKTVETQTVEYDPMITDALAAGIEQARAYHNELPRKRQALQDAWRSLDADIAKLVPHWTRKHLETVDTSSNAYAALQSQSNREAKLHEDFRTESQNERSVKEQIETIEHRRSARESELRTLQKDLTDAESESRLVERKNAVRAMRRILREKEMLLEATSGRVNPFLSAGIIGVLGATLSVAGYFTLTSFTPFETTYVGAVCVIISLILITLELLKGSGSHHASMDELQSQLQEMASRAGAPFSTKPHHTITEATLDTAESSLEALQQTLGDAHRLMAEINEQTEELTLLQKRQSRLTDQLQKIEMEQEEASLNLSQLRATLDLPPNTSAEQGALKLATLEGLQKSHHSLTMQDNDINAMQATIDEWCSAARSLDALAPIKNTSKLLQEASNLLNSIADQRSRIHENARVEEQLRQTLTTEQRAARNVQDSQNRLQAATTTLKTIQKEWEQWLIQRHLHSSLSPDSSRDAFRVIERCQEGLNTLKQGEKHVTLLQDELEAFANQQKAILASINGVAPAILPDGSIDHLATTSILANALQKEQNKQNTHARLLEERPEKQRQCDRATAELSKYTLERQALLQSGLAGTSEQTDQNPVFAFTAEHEEQFRTRATAYSKQTGLTDEINRITATLEASAGEGGLKSLAASFTDTSDATLEEKTVNVEELSKQLAMLETEEGELVQRISDTSLQLKKMGSTEDMALLRSSEALAREELNQLGKEWTRHAIAKHLIMHAKAIFERDRQPQVIKNAGQFFADITENAYSGLHTTLGDTEATIQARTAKGELLLPEQLSRGTREQLYLAVRLGYILGHTASAGQQRTGNNSPAEPLPVIMDDIFVNFDPTRARQTATALAKLAEHNQILFFTCHPQTAQMLQKAVPSTALHTVENGKLQQQE